VSTKRNALTVFCFGLVVVALNLNACNGSGNNHPASSLQQTIAREMCSRSRTPLTWLVKSACQRAATA
jgi:hypothetical protein